MKISIIYGGMSTEHEVSVQSAYYIIQNIDKLKYKVDVIYIDKRGKWYKYGGDINSINKENLNNKNKKFKIIENIVEYLNEIDLAFPVLHGKYGEDGSIQGLFEMFNVKYVGCKVLSSSILMDKIYANIIFKQANIPHAKYIYIREFNKKYILVKEDFTEKICTIDEIINILEKELKFPMYVKPSNSGSSIGINKAKNKEELKKYIEYAKIFDKKLIIEENINAREIECSVLGNEIIEVSCLGEIISAEEFYNYNSKYNNKESITQIPAKLDEKTIIKIQEYAKKAYKAADGKGLARVDFFIEKDTEKIFINEINTMPGFTNISMYPKLWETSGIKYSKIIDKIIELSI